MDNDNQKNLIGLENSKDGLVKADINLLFTGDSYGLFVFKKTEKIVTAIYLLTGLMSDNEPMKMKLRDLATEMLSTALGMSERVWGEEIFQKTLIANTCEMSVLFDVALRVKMISTMNHKIIHDELVKFSDFLITSSSNYSSAKIAFAQDAFDGDYNFVPEQRNNSSINESLVLPTLSKDFYKGQNNIKENNVLDKMSQGKVEVSEKNVKDKSKRQEIILSMLKGGSKLTIRDFAKNIKDCSEKTIQRELISLLSNGTIKKEGERRWSKYFLA